MFNTLSGADVFDTVYFSCYMSMAVVLVDLVHPTGPL